MSYGEGMGTLPCGIPLHGPCDAAVPDQSPWRRSLQQRRPEVQQRGCERMQRRARITSSPWQRDCQVPTRLLSASKTVSLHQRDKRALPLTIQLPRPVLKALHPVEISPTGAGNIELSRWVQHWEGAELPAVMATVY